MNFRQKRRIRQRLQALLFCAVLVWMAASFIAAIPAMAMNTPATLSVFSDYARVETYQGYAYALEGKQGEEAIAVKDSNQWQVLCTAPSRMSAVDLVQNCNVPIGIARHLRVLSHKEIAHDIVLAS